MYAALFFGKILTINKNDELDITKHPRRACSSSRIRGSTMLRAVSNCRAPYEEEKKKKKKFSCEVEDFLTTRKCVKIRSPSYQVFFLRQRTHEKSVSRRNNTLNIITLRRQSLYQNPFFDGVRVLCGMSHACLRRCAADKRDDYYVLRILFVFLFLFSFFFFSARSRGKGSSSAPGGAYREVSETTHTSACGMPTNKDST